MRSIRTIHLLAFLAAIGIGLSTGGEARAEGDEKGKGWTAEQQEVWKRVEEYSAAAKNRDLEAYLSFFHPDFVGWLNGMDTTTDKGTRGELLRRYFAATTSPEMTIEPMAIRVFGTCAVVHYRIVETLRMADGRDVPETEYWTDVLVKEKGRWFLVADHGGSIEEGK